MPKLRFSLALSLAALAGPIGGSAPAAAQQDYLYGERNFRNYCRPPLKYAGGACVRQCPGGYREQGRGYCKPPSPNGFGR